MDLCTAQKHTTILITTFSHACQRIAVAGSVRREKPEGIKDIELIAIPTINRPTFGAMGAWSEVDKLIARLEQQGKLIVTLGAKHRAHQRKMVKFRWLGSEDEPEATVDMFLQPDPATWPVNMLIRTGSADFSAKMLTKKSRGGYMPDEYRSQDARIWRGNQPLPLEDEREIFDLWEMPYREPQERNL